ncbi:YdcF family protein [Coralloluteibacterium thermophilus]|uniref:YdcF family protein n=1 Tax=Coralloluteibacterium thermophilum TaxID=2707049 RepID=A0ABV9NHI7_9GAMM
MSTLDPHRHLDIAHSLAVAALATLVTGGLLYLGYLLRALRTAWRAPLHAEGDVVLVFGKRLRDGRPDADFRERLARALALVEAQPGRTLVLMGGGPPEAREADVGHAALIEMGLHESAVVLREAESLDTLENLRNARALMTQAGLRPRALLLSNRYHLARCVALAESLGFEAVPVAADERFRWHPRALLRLCGEAGYLCWLDLGGRWARLIGHRRMLARIT